MPKRDDDYLRKMLFDFEQDRQYELIIGGVIGMDDEERKKEYHVMLACDAGLMVEQAESVYRLTSQGHDYAGP